MSTGRDYCRIPILFYLLMFACTPPVLLQKERLSLLFEPLFQVENGASGTAYGDAVICIHGESHRGSVEVTWDSTGVFNADFYSSLGITIASMRSLGREGTMTFDGQDYSFRQNQVMDTLPFSWGGDLTFGEFMPMLLGTIPASFKSETIRPPDSIIYEKKAIKTVWKTDTMRISCTIDRKARGIKAAELICAKRFPAWSLLLRKFKSGRAYKIELRENDGNYFFIKYAKVKIR